MNEYGLLDDPKTLGLLSLGLRLMSTPGKFPTALGVAGQGALGDVLQRTQVNRESKRRDELAKLQADELAMRQEEAQRRQKAEQERRAYLLSIGGGMGPPEQINPAVALARGLSGQEIGALMPQGANGPEYKVVGDALLEIGPNGVRPVFQKPKDVDWNQLIIPGPDGKPIINRALLDAKSQIAAAGKPSTKIDINNPGPVPASVVKQQDELIDRMTTARAIDADMGALESQIKSGALKFGPVRNLVNQGKNIAGVSDEESRNFATFKSTLEKLRNDSLRLNTGVQTEGDAQRAWNELFQNINDTGFVQKRLGEIRKINQRAAQLQQYRLQVLRENFNAGPLPDPQIQPALSAGGLTPDEQAELERLRKQLGK